MIAIKPVPTTLDNLATMSSVSVPKEFTVLDAVEVTGAGPPIKVKGRNFIRLQFMPGWTGAASVQVCRNADAPEWETIGDSITQAGFVTWDGYSDLIRVNVTTLTDGAITVYGRAMKNA